jgi:Natural resistance-associated macrophage protein
MTDKTVSGGDEGTSAKGDASLVGDSAPALDAGGGFEPASGPDREFVGATGVRAYVRALGPGLITGASDDDPSGIATYAQAGARFGFSMLWVALLTLPLMMGIQEICDRTALASGKTLGELITVHFGRLVVLVKAHRRSFSRIRYRRPRRLQGREEHRRSGDVAGQGLLHILWIEHVRSCLQVRYALEEHAESWL